MVSIHIYDDKYRYHSIKQSLQTRQTPLSILVSIIFMYLYVDKLNSIITEQKQIVQKSGCVTAPSLLDYNFQRIVKSHTLVVIDNSIGKSCL